MRRSRRRLRPRLGAGERGDLGNRQRFRALEEQRLGHPTRAYTRLFTAAPDVPDRHGAK